MTEKVEKLLKQYNKYKVGYKCPPKSSQFKKGQSGNPAGRKKKLIPKSVFEAIQLELTETVTINENGKSVKLTKYQLLAKTLVNDAIKNDKGNSRKLVTEKLLKMDLLEYRQRLQKQVNEAESEMDPEYEALLKRWLLDELDKLYREKMEEDSQKE